jgi:hypothetical protein
VGLCGEDNIERLGVRLLDRQVPIVHAFTLEEAGIVRADTLRRTAAADGRYPVDGRVESE